MKKILYILLIAVAALYSCKKEEEQTTKLALEVVLSQETLDLNVGETATLTARTLPAEVGQNVTWSVMDPEIASVENGVVTAIAPGVTYVVATSEDMAIKSSCLLHVHKVAPYEFLMYDAQGNEVTEICAYPGYTTTIDVFTTDYQPHTFTWSSSNTAVAQVTKNGVITLKASFAENEGYLYYGESIITIKADDGYGLQFKVTSSLASMYQFDQEKKALGTAVSVPANTSHSVSLLYFNGETNAYVPASGYTLTSSATSNVQLKKVSDTWQLNAMSNEGISQITFKIGDAAVSTLADITVTK